MSTEQVHVFIVSSKGIPARYGGFETFTENLTARKLNKDIKYHVSCMDNDERHFVYNGADCFNVKLPVKGALGRILHVARVLCQIEEWRKTNRGEKAVVYILGCRIGPLIIPHAQKLKKMDIRIFVNTDGLEWKRDKWGKWEKKFLKYCEKCLILNADLVICDSVNIERYVWEAYPQVRGKTKYIAYGTDLKVSSCPKEKLDEWLHKQGIECGQYYLIIGRFVPENNYETMITEFLKSGTKKSLVIITNVENNKFYKDLMKKTSFEKDERIKFAGTVYDAEFLKKIRECAYAYIHGHEVGGTNPSLLEALASTKLNLLLDVRFNREVAGDGALYWKKHELAGLITTMDNADKDYCEKMYKKNTNRVMELYSWEKICRSYETIFMD